jgi:undecaprenyl phosphate N,N'-diacetylbacillosamine 1-phosphate transferase
MLSPFGYAMGSILRENRMYKKIWKRLFDIIFAVLGFPFFLILLIIVAAMILLDDQGPVFYAADRLGKDGKIFRMYKFRSMKTNAPDYRNSDGSTFNSMADDRVTPVGRLLRKTSIDEIPQIMNVLAGNMSFIGPRPDLPDAMDIYSERDKQKLSVLPGITGLSQAYYRNSSTLEQRFSADVYYAEHVSLTLDMKILFKSIWTIIAQKNVYRNNGESNDNRKGSV